MELKQQNMKQINIATEQAIEQIINKSDSYLFNSDIFKLSNLEYYNVYIIKHACFFSSKNIYELKLVFPVTFEIEDRSALKNIKIVEKYDTIKQCFERIKVFNSDYYQKNPNGTISIRKELNQEDIMLMEILDLPLLKHYKKN